MLKLIGFEQRYSQLPCQNLSTFKLSELLSTFLMPRSYYWRSHARELLQKSEKWRENATFSNHYLVEPTKKRHAYSLSPVCLPLSTIVKLRWCTQSGISILASVLHLTYVAEHIRVDALLYQNACCFARFLHVYCFTLRPCDLSVLPQWMLNN